MLVAVAPTRLRSTGVAKQARELICPWWRQALFPILQIFLALQLQKEPRKVAKSHQKELVSVAR